MRKIIVFNRVTVDGMYAGSNGEIDWFIPDPEIDVQVFGTQNTDTTDTVIFGRITYELFESYWPKVAEGATNLEYSPEGEEAQANERKIAEKLTSMTKLVATHEPREFSWENSQSLEGELVESVRAIKAGDGGDIIIFGSGTIIQQLQNAGLIDEYWLILTPVVLGQGKVLFRDVNRFNLQLQSSQTSSLGNVLLHYTAST